MFSNVPLCSLQILLKVRTKVQQKARLSRRHTMIDQVKTVIARADRTLVHDAIGAIALMTIFVATLHIPVFV
jgi:hypothetical protein